MAVSDQSISATANALKAIYSPDELMFKLSRHHALWNDIKKSDTFEGDSIVHMVQHGFNQGIGTSMLDAETNMSTDLDARFTVTRKKIYAAGKIEREVILATRSNKGSVVRQLKRSLDSCLFNLERTLNFMVWGDGGGAYAVITSTATPALTISNLQGMHWLEKDMMVHYSADRGATGTATVLQNGGAEGAVATGLTNTILSVNRRTGVVTMSAAIDNDVAAGQFIFRKGTKAGMPYGVRAWVPQTDALAAATFAGQDRSLDTERLGGLRYLDPAATYAETIRLACAYASNIGGEFSTIYMNPIDVAKLQESERSDVVHDSKRGELDIGFDVVKFRTPIGTLDLLDDSGCPEGWAFICDPSVFEFKHLGKVFGFFEEDGLLQRIAGYDGYGFRGGTYGNLVCHDPKSAMWVKLKASPADV